MEDHANDLIPLLLWMIIAVGSTLLSLVIWIGKRLQDNVDKLPELISAKVKTVHDDILFSMHRLAASQHKLEEELRGQLSNLDRRVVTLEVKCEFHRKEKGE